MKVGIFRTCGIGDALQMTPLLRQIKADVPDAEVHVFTSANAAPALEGNPWAQVHPIPTAWLGAAKGKWGMPRAWNRVRQAGPFDLFLCLEPGWRRSLGSLLVSAREKAGFVYGKKWPRLFCKELPVVHGEKHHNAEAMIRLWTFAMGTADRGFGYDCTYLPSKNDDETMPWSKPYAVLAPGAGNFLNEGDAKKWPTVYWVSLMELFANAGVTPVIVGLAGDFPEGKGADRAVNMTGRLNLRQTAAVIAGADAFVGNDSGLLHMAGGLGVPSWGLFGPTLPVHTGPFRQESGFVMQVDLECLGCGKLTCPLPDGLYGEVERPYCLHLLKPENVFQSVTEHLRKGRGENSGQSA